MRAGRRLVGESANIGEDDVAAYARRLVDRVTRANAAERRELLVEQTNGDRLQMLGAVACEAQF